jgi:hypothetical protein
MHRVVALCALLLLAACAATPKDIAITPTSDKGLIVVEVEPPQILNAYSQYTLSIQAYDPATQRLTSNFFGGWAGIDPQSAAVQKRTYLVGQAKPGTYALTALEVSIWGVCYNGGTMHFDVRPGTVTFVGRFDPNPSLTELFMAAQTGKIPSVGNQYSRFYLFDESRPDLTPPADVEGWEANVTAYLAANYPNVAAPIVQAALGPAEFGTGRSLDGTLKLCGGYYVKDRAPEAPPAA